MRSIVFLIACTLFAPASSLGQPEVVSIELTLDAAVARGLAASHRVEEIQARQEAAASIADARKAAALPQVSALGGYTRTNHVDVFGILLPTGELRVVYPDIPDNYRTRLDVQMPVYTGGRLQALSASARLESVAASDDLEAVKTDLRFEITRAFWNLVVAGESTRVVDESLARMGAHLQDIRNQFAQGLVPPNEVSSVEAQDARQRMLSIQARSARDVAEAELSRLVGVPFGTRIQPLASLEPAAAEGAYDELVRQAIAERGDRRALVGRAGAAETRQQAAAAGRRPLVSIGGGVDYASPNTRIFPRQEAWKTSWDASVNVSWPIFDGGRARAETAEAAASRRALQARVDELDSTIALEIRQRLAEIESSRAAIAAADAAVRAATEARRVVGDRFRAGVAASTDVLDAQVGLLQALLDRTQALANEHLAHARLQRAIGR